MGALTDYFIGTPGEAEEVIATNSFDGVPTAMTKGLPLYDLFMAILGLDLDAAIAAEAEQLIAEFDADGPWLWMLPPHLVRALANLQGDELLRAAERLAAEGVGSSRNTAAMVADIAAALAKLAALAGQSAVEGRQMFHLVRL